MGGISTTFNLPEFVENDLLVFRSDTYARICHGHAYKVPVVYALDSDIAAFGCEFHRVAEQVVEDLLKADAICPTERLALYSLLNPDVLSHSQRMNGGKNFRYVIFHQKILD